MQVLSSSMLLALPLFVGAIENRPVDASTNSTDTSAVGRLARGALDSPAQVAVRKLATPDVRRRPAPAAGAEIVPPDQVTRLEEIRVYGRNEPEDYVGPKQSPMMQFRARLEKGVPLPPVKKLQLALCVIGLCGIYGPEGIPAGDSPEARADARLIQSTVQLNAQFRGTLQ